MIALRGGLGSAPLPVACAALGCAALAVRVPGEGAVAVVLVVGAAAMLMPLPSSGVGRGVAVERIDGRRCAPAAPRPRVPRVLVLGAGIGAFALVRVGAGSSLADPTAVAVMASLVAAVAEEAMFRRLVYGVVGPFGAGAAVAVGAVLFAVVHVRSYGAASVPLNLAAGLVLGWQRWASGTWAVPAATHAAANLVAAS